MSLYLLDTNIVSDLVRHPRGLVRDRIQTVGEDRVATSVIVAAELRYGAAKKGSDRLTSQIDAILAALQVLAWDVPYDGVYGHLRAELERKGKVIGGNDLLIAAHAVALDATLVTVNTGEFARIPELRHENWLSAGA